VTVLPITAYEMSGVYVAWALTVTYVPAVSPLEQVEPQVAAATDVPLGHPQV
jgi:hypothetical protein